MPHPPKGVNDLLHRTNGSKKKKSVSEFWGRKRLLDTRVFRKYQTQKPVTGEISCSLLPQPNLQVLVVVCQAMALVIAKWLLMEYYQIHTNDNLASSLAHSSPSKMSI